MSSFQLKAEKREKLGSLEARRIKLAGKIPAIIYSKNGNINISVDKREFETEYFKGNIQTRVAEVEISGKKIKVIAHKIDVDPVSDKPIHIDLLNCDETKQIKAKPKLIFINQDKSAGIKKGGILHVVMRKVEVVCADANKIPDKIEIDVAPLHIGSKIRSNDIILPAGSTLSRKDNFLLASIIGRGKSEDEVKVAGATDAAAGATAAAGAAAAPAAGGAKAAAKPAAKPAEKKK